MASADFLKIGRSAINGTVVHFDECMRKYKKHANRKINPELSHLNYNLTNFGDGTENWQDVMQECLRRVDEIDKIYPPARVRDDRKVADYLYIPCPKAIEDAGREDEFFSAVFDLQKNFFGDNFVGMQVHKDEKHLYRDGGKNVESLYHSHSLLTAYAEWEDGKGNLRQGINSKNFNTKEMYKDFNDTMQNMVMERFNISYQTGNYQRRGKTVEQLKWESEREIFSEKITKSEQKIEELEIEMASLTHTNKIKKRENLQLENENENLKSEIKYNENDLFLLQKQVQEQEKIINIKEQIITEKDNIITQNNNIIKDQDSTINNVKNDCNNILKGFEKDLSLQVQNNFIAQEDIENLTKDLEQSFNIVYEQGYSAGKYNKDVIINKQQTISKEISTLFAPNTTFGKLSNVFTTLNQNMLNLAQECAQKARNILQSNLQQRAQNKIINNAIDSINVEKAFNIFFDKSGNITEKSSNYIKQQIINNINNKTADGGWKKLQKIYLDLDLDGRDKLINYIHKDVIGKLIDLNANKIEDIKFKQMLYKYAPTYNSFGNGLLHSYMQLQQQVIDGYER